MRARVSDCTRSTAASAVRPVITASSSCAPSRGRGRTCGRLRARRDARRRRRRRRARAARRGRRAGLERRRPAAARSFGGSSAMKLVITTRGSCSTTWPSAMPSLSAVPLRCSGAADGRLGAGLGERRAARPRRSSRRAPWRWSAAPRPPPRNRCAARGSAPPARRACCRRAGSARRGRSGRFPRRSPAGRRRPDGACASDRLIGLASLRDQADQALVGAQHGLVDGLAVEAFGGVELERAVDAQHVDASRPPPPCWRRSAPRSCRGVPAR